jgi:DNA transposition AAA+ family ATPase
MNDVVELPSQPADFIVTKEYRRFAEFCDACREARYIGLCYGLPGVGKTVSARQYAHWNQLEALLGGPPPYRHAPMPPQGSGPWADGAVYAQRQQHPEQRRAGGRQLVGAVQGLSTRAAWYGDPTTVTRQPPDLLVVDEADRLKTASLEQLRDFYDRRQLGVVLIGMPRLEKRLACYAQLYSRVGFVHQFTR